MKRRFRFKLRTKILLSLLWISLISLILFAIIVFRGMRGLGQYSLKSSTSLGDQAVDDSIKALEDQAKGHLLRMAKDQAALSSVLLEKVENEVSIVTAYATRQWENPVVFDHIHSYSQEEEPGDIYAVSVYTLAPGVNYEAVKKEIDISSMMDNIFIPVFDNDPNLDTICLGTESGIFRSFPWRSGRAASYDHRKREWYRKAAERENIIWSEPYIHAATKELIITCAKPFYSIKGKLAGVVEADVTLKVLNNRIMSTQIGKLGYAFLLDKNGRIIARPGLTPGDTRWDETYKTENLLESDNEALRDTCKKMVAGDAGIQRVMLDDGEKYIAFAPIKGTSWSLGIVMPVKEIVAPALVTKGKIMSATEKTGAHINRRIVVVRNTIFLIFIGMIFLVLIIAFRLSRRITGPILALSKGVKVAGRGDLDHRLNVETGDEIEDLANAFNNMTRDLKVYIKRLTETTAEKERIEEELRIAHDIQMSIVPKIFPPFPERPEFDIHAILEPAKEVGGDFYDFFFVDEDRLCFVIGDVSGKGVPASLFMAVTITLIKKVAKDACDPAEVMRKVNEEIAKDNDTPMFVTVFCGFLDIKTGKVTYCNAGHNKPLVAVQKKEPEFLHGAGGMVIGIIREAEYRSGSLELSKGDTLYMYTDGVTEAFNSKREQFSDERLKQNVSFNSADTSEKLVVDILKKVRSFAHKMPQSDDITIMALRYNGRA